MFSRSLSVACCVLLAACAGRRSQSEQGEGGAGPSSSSGGGAAPADGSTPQTTGGSAMQAAGGSPLGSGGMPGSGGMINTGMGGMFSPGLGGTISPGVGGAVPGVGGAVSPGVGGVGSPSGGAAGSVGIGGATDSGGANAADTPGMGGAAGLGAGGVQVPVASSGGAAGSSAGGAQVPAGGSAGAAAQGTGGTEEVGMAGPPYTFPQNHRSSYCTYPAAAHSEHARTVYEQWKAEMVTSEGAGGYLRVRRPGNEEDTTVSEGTAYGMIFALVMDDSELFDNLWLYSQQHLNENGLMNWLIGPDNTVQGEGAATDSDEDMAWALALAAHKWGGGGSLGEDYSSLAQTQIQRIWDHEVDHTRGELLLAGDSWGVTLVFNPSYFAPNQYRLFGRLTGNEAGWNQVIDTGYAVLNQTLNAERGNLENGLVPAWADADGNPSQPFEGALDHYQYDSARVPFRIGQDYCEFGEPRAKAYLDKTSAFFSAIGAGNIVDGYDLDGTPRPENTSPAGVQSALFVGAAGVGAMSDPAHAAFIDDVYNLLVNQDPPELLLPPSYYYNYCWKLFSLLIMSGNLFDYTLQP